MHTHASHFNLNHDYDGPLQKDISIVCWRHFLKFDFDVKSEHFDSKYINKVSTSEWEIG